MTADIYFENGIIYTVDKADTIAEALAVKDGKILFVGSAKEGQPYKEAAKEVVDLQGRMLLPGLIDAHIHTVLMDYFDIDLVKALGPDQTLENIQKTVADYIQAHPDQESYTGFGYMTSIFEGEELEKGPRKEYLDKVCPDKPLFIYAFDGHSTWTNSKCLEAMGLTPDSDPLPGGQIVIDDVTGELWGNLKDTSMALLPKFEMPADKLANGLENLHTTLNSLGYTSMMNPPGNGFFPVPCETYDKLDKENRLTLRVRAGAWVTGWQTEQDLSDLVTLKEKYNGDLFAVTTAKFFIDGVTDSKSSYLLEPYSDEPGYYGEPEWEPEALNKAVAKAHKRGASAHFHSMGDGATHMVLDAIEYTWGKIPRSGTRNILTHLQLIAPDDLLRFGELGAVAAVQPFWHYKTPKYWATIERRVLGERAEAEYPLKSLANAGAVLAFSSDFPVTPFPNPFLAMEIAVTRNLANGAEDNVPDITDMDDPAYLLDPAERLTIQEAIRGYTMGSAYSISAENETGSLEAGKSADMIVIDQNLLEINPLDISDTKVLRTYLQGNLVYSAQS